jgi:hypothetical protein
LVIKAIYVTKIVGCNNERMAAMNGRAARPLSVLPRRSISRSIRQEAITQTGIGKLQTLRGIVGSNPLRR